MRSNNSQISGGFPHSEIHGSKPIPGSPWLNAGYHVLHRLLLPRHPPNALFALDLVQKEQDRRTLPDPPRTSQTKSSTFPRHAPLVRKDMSVSVLDLEQYRLRARSRDRPQVLPHAEEPAILMFLSERCQFGLRPSRRMAEPASDWTIKPIPDGLDDAVVKGWWVEEDSNLRPHAYQACALTT